MAIQTDNNEILKKEMTEKGVIFGHKISKTYPQMKKYTDGSRGNIALINLDFTIEGLNKAVEFLREKILSGQKTLFVGCAPASQDAVKEAALQLDSSYVVNRWIGGLLTNFKIVRKRIDLFLTLKKKQESGEFEKYTKKEQIKINKDIERMTFMFNGLERMEKLPDAIFIVNIVKYSIVVKEAKKMKIPIAAIVNTNADPRLVDYPIFANDNAKSSISCILNKIVEGVKQ